jgi:hypothetical protein
MQKALGFTLAAVPWLMTIFKLGSLRRRRQDRQVLAVWLFFLFSSIALTLHIGSIGLSLDELIGVTNLSWLLNYLAATLSFYFLSASFYTESGVGQNRRMLPVTAVIAGSLVLVYIVGIIHLPENTEHTSHTAWELLFKELIYVYGGGVSAIVLRLTRQMIDSRDTISVHLRLYTAQVAAFLSILFYVIKFVTTVIGFLAPSSSMVGLFLGLAQLLQIGSILVWPFFFASNETFLKLARPLLAARKLVAIRDLKKLDSQLSRLFPSDTPDLARRRQVENLGNLDIQLYRLVISILDKKKSLVDQIRGRTPPDSVQWSDQEAREATELHRALETVPNDQDFDNLVTTLREIAMGKV